MIALQEPFRLFTPQECDEILARVQDLKPARVVGGELPNVRNNSVYWMDFEDQGRFYDIMTDREDVPVRWLQHPYQISRYAPGEFYDWHVDLIESRRSSIRSLTLTCTLEPAPGASIQFETREFELEKGWAVLFDAHTSHRANPPQSGERWALTVWGMQDNPNKDPSLK